MAEPVRGWRLSADKEWGGDGHRSLFFLSYAHTPVNSQVGGDPNHWVHRLFQDLCAAVMQLTVLQKGEQPGFMDRGMHLGEGWAERIEEELANCRVFVPLYSPRYFHSVVCGQEWDAFASRPVYQVPGSRGHASGIVPVLWVPGRPSALPQIAGKLQFNHSDFGPDYVAEGMYALLKLTYFRNAYELAVHRLAQRIVQVVEQTMIPRPLQRVDLLSRPSAFEEPVSARRLRIAVLACKSAELPPGRSAASYGESPLDWQPYHGRSSRPLVQHADRLVRQLGFHPSVHTFEEEAGAVLRSEEPEAPGLLLLDRWALLDPERRRLVKEFDQRDPRWISLMEPWNVDDPECRAADGELHHAAEEVLWHRRRDQRPSLRYVPGMLSTLDEFENELPGAVQRAMYGFIERGGDSASSAPLAPLDPGTGTGAPADAAASAPSSTRPSLRHPPPGGPPPADEAVPGEAPPEDPPPDGGGTGTAYGPG